MSHPAPLIETSNLQGYEKAIADGLADLASRKIISRIWKKDWTVWREDPAEVRNRLGWLTSPRAVEKHLAGMKLYARRIRQKGFTNVLLLGMGGSSLAPYVLASVFKASPSSLNFGVLDLTDPAAVLGWQRKLNPEKTLFLVSSKSGTTVETSSFFRFFWNFAADRLGTKTAGSHFAAITDPGTPLEGEARTLGFSAVFTGNPEIGGRFSALSPFCLVPAALMGGPIETLVETGRAMSDQCRRQPDLMANPGALIGTILGVLARSGRDKLTFLLSPRLRSFGLWLEQLIAESTGKDGKGILPVTGESVGAVASYGEDRIFVHIKMKAEREGESSARHIESAGFPLVSLAIPAPGHLGGQFFLWEFSTAVAGYFLGINPFDQPDVDSAKKRTQEFVRYYLEHGSLPPEKPRFRKQGIGLYAETGASSFDRSLNRFLFSASPGDYLAVLAFLAPSKAVDDSLQKLRHRLRDRTGLATTVGYGPRFLHSTGQLHKGDRGHGLFLQITAEDRRDAPIPDSPGDPGSSLSFGLLKAAQARGDFEALRSRGRRIVRLHLGKNPAADLERLLSFWP